MKPWHYPQRWALVTGASAGIGAAFARRLAARGMNLVLTARRLDRLESLAGELERDHGSRTAVVQADLASRGETDGLWHAANQGRTIDLLVNNAGFGTRGAFADVPLERHRAIAEVNAIALMELSYLAIRDMRPRGDGAIINVSSITAFQPVPQLATYAASKAFVLSLSEALWAENRALGIRVLALCPGRTPTEFQQVAGTGTAHGAFGFRTPEQVVDSTLRALERGHSYIVPGMENLIASWATRSLPRAFVNRVLKAAMKRVRREHP